MKTSRHANNIPKLLENALQLQQAGRPQEAEALLRKVLRIVPDLPEAMHFLGLALHQQGKSGEGIRLMRQSVARNPNSPIFHNNLGHILKTTGHLDEAEKHHRTAIRLQPNYAEAWFNLGVVLQDKSELREAAEAYSRAIALRPSYTKALINLAGVFKEVGRYEDAAAACRQALTHNPCLPEAYSILADALVETGEAEVAEATLRDGLKILPNDSQLLVALSKALMELGRHGEADEIYRGVLDSWPNEAEAHVGRGSVAQFAGDHDTGLGHFERGLALRPGNASAILGISGSKKFSAQELSTIQGYERTLFGTELSPTDATSAHFALGKMYDDIREFDKAFLHYSQGNALRHRQTRFDCEKHTALVDGNLQVFTADYFRSRGADFGQDSDLPVFIVGMPRSGTTLVEQIISSHPLVKAAGEILRLPRCARIIPSRLGVKTAYPYCVGDLDSQTARAIAQEYLDSLPPRMQGETRVTDKLPTNFLYIGLIATLFPNAHIIHCRRDPMDVCLSIYFQLFSPAVSYAFDLSEIGFFYRQYERCMAHWHTLPGLRLHEVNYSDLISDQESVSRRMIEFIGLEWDQRCLEFYKTERNVKTASLWQVRQPIYKSSVERWRNYEKHLGPLIEALQGKAVQVQA